MIDSFLFQLSQYKWLLVVYVVISIAIYLFFYFKVTAFGWENKNIKIFAILYNFNKRCLLSFSVMLGRLIFIVYLVITGGTNDIADLFGILFLTIFVVVFSKPKEEYFQFITYTAVYILILLEGLFQYYYREMSSSFTIMVLSYLFGLFAISYSIYSSLGFIEKLFSISNSSGVEKLREE